jgi:hypothetical protein
MSLSSNIVRVNFTRQLHILNQVTIRASAREDKPTLRNLVSVAVVNLVAVAVALASNHIPIYLSDNAARLKFGLVKT